MITLIKHTLRTNSTPRFQRFCSNFSKSNLKKLLDTMPKELKHVFEAQRQRLKIKEKFQKYVPGKVTLQVLGSGAEGAPKALYMFTDQSRYLFNCGEGTQRLAHEHKMKLSKLEHIFITQPTWNNIGGLPGVSLTIQDVGVPQITLHGPDGLDELFIATRRFIILKDLKIRMASCKPENIFEDNVMSVNYVPIIKETIKKQCEEQIEPLNDKAVQVGVETIDACTSTQKNKTRNRKRSRSRNKVDSSDDETDYYAHEQSNSRTTPELLPQVAHEEREQNTTMCYVCKLNPRPGALSLDKCVEAGVPPGPLLGQLKGGKDVTLDSGVVVRSQDVCLPDDPGPVILIVDCPSIEYLDSFVNNEVFVRHQGNAKTDEDFAYLVVHFTSSNIMQTPKYREWINKFSLSTQHLVLNDLNQCMGSISVHRIQHKLNMLHNDIFPLLGDNGTRVLNEDSAKRLKLDQENNSSTCDLIETLTVNSRPTTPDHLVHPNTFCSFHVRPKKGFDRSGELELIPSQYVEETMVVEGFPEALQLLKTKLKAYENMNVRPYPRILFLGTGSCIPNKTRNTSGILVQTSEKDFLIMDCGEGTYGQLVRFYGYEKAKIVLANLNCVYISHLHADHHIGLVGLLKGRQKAMEKLKLKPKPLILLAPKQILSWLHFYHRRFENISNDYELITNGDLILGSKNISGEQRNFLQSNIKMKDVSTVLVRHCPFAFGVAFTHVDGWKITYSGDTMPCDRLIDLGIDSDILIHEATMEDELAHEAISKMHSTTSQAISIGQKMNAKNILLTHFSQRYAKLPRFNDNFADNVGIAFDNMQVRMDELKLLPLFYPVFLLMFAEHYEELEHKAVKRQLKAERRETSLERKAI